MGTRVWVTEALGQKWQHSVQHSNPKRKKSKANLGTQDGYLPRVHRCGGLVIEVERSGLERAGSFGELYFLAPDIDFNSEFSFRSVVDHASRAESLRQKFACSE